MTRIFMALLVAITMFGASTGRPSASDDDQVILKIDGKLTGQAPISFTRSQLEQLGIATVRTSTPWHDGQQVFEGVPMAALMEAVKARGTTLDVIALNRYRTTLPIEDFKRHGTILALKRNGQYMAVRDKGPLFIIYPYDSNPALRTEQYYSRSAWQVATITVN